MKLSYLDLLSPEPIYLENIGQIISPTLRDISRVGNTMYQQYLWIFSMDSDAFFRFLCQDANYEAFSETQKMSINIPELLFSYKQFRDLLQNALNFFFVENVFFSDQHNCFLLEENEQIIGYITPEQYPLISDVICQKNGITSKQEYDLSKIKNKKALEIMKKLRKGKSDSQKRATSDSNMELGNIISAVANKSESLNILNIWDLTIYQLWDCFTRLSNNNIYHIQAMSVAAWGDKNNHFDTSAWFKKIVSNN